MLQTWETGHFKLSCLETSRLETSRLETSHFHPSRLSAVASGPGFISDSSNQLSGLSTEASFVTELSMGPDEFEKTVKGESLYFWNFMC